MLLALDYDSTYTQDPELWDMFIESALSRGHQIICATMRTPEEIGDFPKQLTSKLEVICTSRKAKLPFLSDKGFEPDVWIDDMPYWILNNSG